MKKKINKKKVLEIIKKNCNIKNCNIKNQVKSF